MGTGLIVAFVVTVWAAYFVPLALRRYDEAHNHSALEALTPLSRVIRRAPVAHEADDFEYTGDPIGASLENDEAETIGRPRPGLTRASARIAARRRRRVLLTLLFANAVVGGLVGFAIIPMWSVAIPAGLLVAWLVACRIQVRQEYGIASTRKPRSKPGRSRMPRVSVPKLRVPRVRVGRSAAEDEDTVTIIVSGQFEDVDPGRKHIMENAPLEADALDEQLVIAVPSAASHGELVWDPLPVTLPTYVTKPRAGRTVRTIDFDAPGVWTSGHVEGEETELPVASAEQSSSDDQRRAAGE